jgi:uncharacterized membrane protein YphA (DoxX/SURF4 family)
MRNLSDIGRIFYGIAMAEMGLQTIYCQDFPYFMLPPVHPGKAGLIILTIILGIVLTLAGACIVFRKKARQVALLFGGLLLLIFCFWHVPYELIAGPDYKLVGNWENAVKELALAGGALVIAGCFQGEDKNASTRLSEKLVRPGAILFALPIIFFGILHFVYAKEAGGYIPSWIPGHLFWMYFCGAALLGSGIAILSRIQARLAATLLGIMIFTWFVILHTPKVIAAPPADRTGELSSAFLALAYCGIAFVIAGMSKKQA